MSIISKRVRTSEMGESCEGGQALRNIQPRISRAAIEKGLKRLLSRQLRRLTIARTDAEIHHRYARITEPCTRSSATLTVVTGTSVTGAFRQYGHNIGWGLR